MRFGRLYPSMSWTLVSCLPRVSVAAVSAQQSGFRTRKILSSIDARRSRHRCGSVRGDRQAQVLPQPDHMSYETAQKVQQQQLKDRVVYAVILSLGFVALYINIKRAANEHAEWEKSHS